MMLPSRALVRSAGSRRAASLAFSKPLQPRIPIRCQTTAPATIVDRGFWRSLIPKPMRKENRQPKTKSKEWNPATFFIVIFLLIGSMSIQMIALRNSFQRYMRQSNLKIAMLRDVVDRIQRGEDVDVERALGTGNPEKEADWEEVLRAIESDDGAPKTSKSKNTKRQEQQAEQKPEKSNDKGAQQVSAQPTQATGKPSSGFGSFF